MAWITTVGWPVTQSQTSWSVEVKWALGSITMNKASGGDGISVELFQILKEYAFKVLPSIYQHIWKTQQWPKEWKRSLFIPMPKKVQTTINSTYFTYQQGNAQNPSSQTSTVDELRTHRYRTWVQKRQKQQRSNCQHSLDHRESKGIPEKLLLLLHQLH